MTDTTENRPADDQFGDSRAQLERTAYELTVNIPVGTYTMVQPADGGMGFFSFMSQRFLDICGLDREEAMGDPFKAFACVHPDDYDEWVRKNAEVFEKKLPFFGECRVVVDGVVRWITAESRPRPLPDGSTVWEGVLIDITRQKQAEQELDRAREAERRSDEAHRRELEHKLKTSLTAAAAVHEIKQPLSRILIETQLAVQRLHDRSLHPDEIRGYLEEMLAESQRVVEMIGRMKVLLRNVKLERQPFCVADVVAGAVLYSKRLITDHGVKLHQLGFEDDTRIDGDGPQVQTAVINLIRNAVEAVADRPAGSREVAVELRVIPTGVAIFVGDSGPGMSAAQISNLPFETTKPDGTGLGLYLVRTCAENHGGTMNVGRSPLGGAEVRLELPLERSVA